MNKAIMHGVTGIKYASFHRVWPRMLDLIKTLGNVSLKPISFTLPFLLSMYSSRLSQDISGIDQALSFHLAHISLSFTVISFTPIIMLFDL